MDAEIQEIKENLKELTELVEENHKILNSLNRRAQLASLFVIVKWGVIIALSVGTAYYLQPYLETLLKTYTTMAGFTEKMGGSGSNSGGSTQSILDLLKSF